MDKIMFKTTKEVKDFIISLGIPRECVSVLKKKHSTYIRKKWRRDEWSVAKITIRRGSEAVQLLYRKRSSLEQLGIRVRKWYGLEKCWELLPDTITGVDIIGVRLHG